MRKFYEVKIANSCLNRAKLSEFIFVLLERDIAAPATIRFWCLCRILLFKNKPWDPQIKEAMKAAKQMVEERKRKLLKEDVK